MPALPEPILARSGRLPDEDGYAYEPKWDGFRAIVRGGNEFRVRSRRGWNVTVLVPELAALPINAVLDGELVALDEDGTSRPGTGRAGRGSAIGRAITTKRPAPQRF